MNFQPSQTPEAVKAILHSQAFCKTLGLDFDSLDEQQKTMVFLVNLRCGDELFDTPDEMHEVIDEVSNRIHTSINLERQNDQL